MGYLILFFFFGYLIALVVALFWNLIQRALRFIQGIGSQPHIQNEQNPTILVILIHGTWSPHAKWMQNDSNLCNSIQKALPNDNVKFVAFRWSGRNSVSARFKAGEELSKLLNELCKGYPQARQIIICHSHGGSVALSALRHELENMAVIGVICLSTPFLVAQFRPLSRIAKVGLSITPGLAVSLGLGQLINLSMYNNFNLVVQLFIGVFIITVAIITAIIVPRIVKSLAEKIFIKMQLAELNIDRLLIIRSPGDEASAALGTVQLLNFVISKVWEGASQILDDAIQCVNKWSAELERFGWRTHALIVLIIAVAVLLGVLTILVPDINSEKIYYVVVTLLFVVGILYSVLLQDKFPKFIGLLFLGVLVAPFPVLMAVLLLPFGSELAIVSLVLNVTAESTPPGSWIVHHLKPALLPDLIPRQSGQRLMHSLTYEDPVALDIVVSWIQERIVLCRETNKELKEE